MKAVTFRNGLFLLLLIVLMAYLDSPYSILNKGYVYTEDQPASAQPIESEDEDTNSFVLEDKLEYTEKVDGYIVEIYQEFEVYRDKNGNVIKSIPTSKTETLKYWDYSNTQEKGSE